VAQWNATGLHIIIIMQTLLYLFLQNMKSQFARLSATTQHTGSSFKPPVSSRGWFAIKACLNFIVAAYLFHKDGQLAIAKMGQLLGASESSVNDVDVLTHYPPIRSGSHAQVKC